ncbi:hypothetical protein TVAG_378290 [Trichomonas vaginalis G3]|uniref:Uncharacterized protein n=1 Tax=Trichomonas vaginalis (strain ATCC PRA-98 / G3) TaxID=412133 RepID=A2DB20_TRIV3|nr:hypothetical protein TVAGG3_0518400 [Trichomonas vaginalis G3]EAY22350.1 hypothetical protein TVAG_378290 [Trichomonas vaginalis G3]KAI5518288.1 hypothetical protein TVAGG3_0518400 [Trichomonas vaginalis G3]|eukprot:XP_001583336.1 hypothetical protein [Trichomonas vaginalis G3]
MSRIGLTRSILVNSAPIQSSPIRSETSSVIEVKNDITQEDVNRLIAEKHRLSQEAAKLKARISRLEMQNKIKERTDKENPRFLTRGEFEYRAIEQQLIQQRATMNELLMSDKAAQIYELKESIRLIFEEKERLKDLQLEKQMEINAKKAEWEELQRTDGPEIFQQQIIIIDELKEKLAKFRKANEKLRLKVENLKDQKEIETKLAGSQPKRQTDYLRILIRDAEEATKKIDEKIEESIYQHSEIMKGLHIELLQKGLDKESLL